MTNVHRVKQNDSIQSAVFAKFSSFGGGRMDFYTFVLVVVGQPDPWDPARAQNSTRYEPRVTGIGLRIKDTGEGG